MAANLTPIHPPSLTVRSTTANSTDSVRKNNNNNWWTPLFGWSSEPDYIHSTINTSPAKSDTTLLRSSRASFTDEKAKKLRMLTVESATFHDAMYHSAIASRLASDFSDRTSL